MSQERVENAIKKMKEIKLFGFIIFISRFIEEVLKRRRRTTLVIGAAISLLVYYLKK